MEKRIIMNKELCQEFLDSQREKESQDSFACNKDGDVLYRFMGDCGCWELLRRRRETKENGKKQMNLNREEKNMKTIKELADLEDYQHYSIGYREALKDVLGLIDEEIKELKEIDNKIPEKFKKLKPHETNQHMRIRASLSIARELKERIKGTSENTTNRK